MSRKVPIDTKRETRTKEGTYIVYEWHLGVDGLIGESLSAAQVLDLDFRYAKFNKESRVAWVTNCCGFKCH